MMLSQPSQKGFTLIELIITMVVLSVLAVGSVQFVSYSATAYVQTVQRSHQSARASIINEKISRYLRHALPNSVRINTTGNCIEFIPVRSASQYTQAPIVGSQNPNSEIHIVPLHAEMNKTGYGVIYPIINTELLFNNTRNPGRISTQPVTYANEINGSYVYNLVGGFQFEQHSPSQRVYFVGQPQTLCQQGSVLFVYQNYGFVGSIANLDGALPDSLPNRILLANNLIINSLKFSISSGALKRNNIVSFNYSLQQSTSAEILALSQEVQIRNVP